MRWIRQGRAALLAAVLVTGLAACGGNRHEASNESTGISLLRPTLASNSADVHLTLTAKPAHGAETELSQTGTYSWKPEQATLTLQSTASGQDPLTAEQVIDGDIVYSKLTSGRSKGHSLVPPDIGNSPGWTKTTLSDSPYGNLPDVFADSVFGLTPATAFQPEFLNPAVILSEALDGPPSLNDLGSAPFGHQRATHYQAVIPFAQLGDEAIPFDTKMASLVLPVGTDLQIDDWVDSAGQLLQTQMSITATAPSPAALKSLDSASPTTQPMPIAAPAPIQSSTFQSQGRTTFNFPVIVTLTLQLSNYGNHVDVKYPPPSKITTTCAVQGDDTTCHAT